MKYQSNSSPSEGKPSVLRVEPDAVPKDLQALPRWLCWSYVKRRGKWAKVPMRADGAGPASSSDPRTWCTFDEAVGAYLLGEFDGIGIALGDGLCGLDLDDHVDPATGALDDVAKDALGSVPGYWETSPSGTGAKGLFYTDLVKSVARSQSVGVEFYAGGRYFAITGRLIQDEPHGPDDDRSDAVQEFLARHLGERSATVREVLDTELADQQPLEDWTLDDVRQYILPHLDEEWRENYDQWLTVGQALHHQGRGDVEWLGAWDEWSAEGSNYENGVCADKWASFGQPSAGQALRSLKTLIKAAGHRRPRVQMTGDECFGDIVDDPAALEEQVRASAQDRDAVLARAVQSIADCATGTEIEQTASSRIAPLDWTDAERERLAVAVRARYLEVSSTKLPLETARKLVRPPLRAGSNDAPDWLDEWVYVLESNLFFEVAAKRSLDLRAFSALHTDKMPLKQGSQMRELASEMAVHRWKIRTVDAPLYAPGFPDVFHQGGRDYVNLYDESSVPVARDEGEAGATAVRMLALHLKRMFPDDRERELLLSWMADRVRNPGKKARFAPYISGPEGVGKSFLGDVMQAVLGADNVKRVSGSTLISDFTGWAAGRCLTIIEEVKNANHRYDVAEKLKAPLTNDRIDLHRKGKDPVEVPNVTSYLVLSNHPDGIPITATDRRYMFLASAIGVEEAQSLDKEGYFRTLFDTCLAHPGALRKWFLEDVQIHPEYDRNGRAPWTTAKDVAVELNKSDIKVALERRLQGRNAVTASWAVEVVRKDTGEVLRTRSVAANLVEMGWRFVGRVKRGPLRDHRVWAQGNWPSKGIDEAAKEAEWVNDHKVSGDSWPDD